MKHKSLALVLLLLVSTGLQAQTEDFNEFRNRMMKDFQDFRKGIFDRYAEFLDAAWAEYPIRHTFLFLPLSSRCTN